MSRYDSNIQLQKEALDVTDMFFKVSRFEQ